MLAEPTGYGCEKVVPRKGLEPPLSYREADFKLDTQISQSTSSCHFVARNTPLQDTMSFIF